ncbi:MAG TPA: response regulator [Chloroflexi bacterium]|nr:response regulator [Chloroflexota bacterium]
MSAKPTILIVDSNRSNLELLSQQLGQAGYETLAAASLEELDEAIQGKEKFALSLIDISGFDRHIWERCEALHKAETPCIVISPQRSPSVQRESMKHGASGLLVKPLDFKELLEHVHAVLGD